MKKLFVPLFIMVISISTSYAQLDCTTGCDSLSSTTEMITIDIPVDCGITFEFTTKTLSCNGELVVEIQINGFIAAISSDCAWLDSPGVIMETAIEYVLSSPQYNPLFPPPGTCRTSYMVTGPACWEMTENPMAPGMHLTPCNYDIKCCRQYKVCNIGGVATVIPLPYIPQSCSNVIGPITHLPCTPYCP